MSTSRTFQMKMVRPDEEEMEYLWKLFYASQRVEDRWGHGLAEISEELSYCPCMTREQKLFLLRAWQVLAADKGGFGRFMGAYDTYVHNMQDPDDDCVAWKPNLIELFGSAELLPVFMEAYQEALQRISELERENEAMTAEALAMRDDMRGARSLLESRTNDAWIAHDGLSRPQALGKNDLVYLKTRAQELSIPYPAGRATGWFHSGGDMDIVAYKSADASTHTVTLPDAISLEQMAEIRESLSEQGITLVVGE